MAYQIDEAEHTSSRSERDMDPFLLDLESLAHRSFHLVEEASLRGLVQLLGEAKLRVIIFHIEKHLALIRLVEESLVEMTRIVHVQ